MANTQSANTQSANTPFLLDNTGTSAIIGSAKTISSAPANEPAAPEVNLEVSRDVSLEVIHYPHIYQLATWPQTYQTFLSDVETQLNLTLPAFGQRQADTDKRLLAHLPNKWLLISDTPLSEQLAMFCDNVNGTMLDQSAAYAVIAVRGEKAGDFLQQISFVDYHRQPHSVFITQMMANYTVLVEQLDATTYSLYITRSLAQSFWDALTDKTLLS